MTKKEKSLHSPLRRLLELFRESIFPAKKHDKPVIEGSQRHLSTAHPLARDDNAVMTIGIAPTAMPEIGQQLFVVWDAIGDGRVVGVFADEQLAKKLLTVNPFYYRYYRCQFGRPTDDAIGWLDDKDKAKLACIMNEAAYSSQKTNPA